MSITHTARRLGDELSQPRRVGRVNAKNTHCGQYVIVSMSRKCSALARTLSSKTATPTCKSVLENSWSQSKQEILLEFYHVKRRVAPARRKAYQFSTST